MSIAEIVSAVPQSAPGSPSAPAPTQAKAQDSTPVTAPAPVLTPAVVTTLAPVTAPVASTPSLKRKADVLDAEDVGLTDAALTDAGDAATTPSLKRKADDLDAEIMALLTDATPLPMPTAAGAPNNESAPEMAAKTGAHRTDVQRPRKRLRTALSFAGTVAASVTFGAVAVVGALTALPDSFFE